jgi:hypothetical protein
MPAQVPDGGLRLLCHPRRPPLADACQRRSTERPSRSRSSMESGSSSIQSNSSSTTACHGFDRPQSICEICAGLIHQLDSANRPAWASASAACARFRAPSFVNTDATWLLTVLTAIPSSAAISLSVRPRPIPTRTSRSRRVSVARGSEWPRGRRARRMTSGFSFSIEARSLLNEPHPRTGAPSRRQIIQSPRWET